MWHALRKRTICTRNMKEKNHLKTKCRWENNIKVDTDNGNAWTAILWFGKESSGALL